MIREYDNPNTCYAIGDAVAAYMGTATVNRQPSSGVEEQIAAIIKPDTTDHFFVYNGSTTDRIIANGARTDEKEDSASAWNNIPYNCSIMITNSVYLRKDGTTDRVAVSGVQTNV